MTVYKRNSSKDWVTLDESSFIDPSKSLVLYNNIIYVASATDSTFLYYQTAIKGFNADTGELIQTIPITETAINHDFLEVDQNGYLWTQHYGSGHFPSDPAFRIYDSSTGNLITTFGLFPANLWHGELRVFDPINNLMWLSKDADTIAAVSTETYTEIRTISVTQFRGFGLDTDTGYLWVRDYNSTNLRLYDTTTGSLITTLTTSLVTANRSYKFEYIPSKKWIIINALNALCEVWDTSTNTRVAILYNTSQYTNLNQYLPYNDSIAGQRSTDSSDTYKYSSTNISLDNEDFTTPLLLTLNPSEISFIDQTTSNIYLSGYDEDTSNYYIYKIAFIAVPIIELCSNEDTSSNNTELSNYDAFNRELILDLTLGAFSIYDIAHNNSQAIRDYIEIPPFYLKREDVVLYRGNDVVTDGSGVPLVITGAVSTVNRHTDNRAERFKFLVTSGTDISLAEYRDYRFVDWYSIDGVGLPFNSYLLTGYTFAEDLIRNKQTIYLKLFFERTEDVYTIDSDGNVVLAHQSGCKVQSHWNWNNSVAQGKWGIPFQGYRLLKNQPTSPAEGDTFDYGEKVIVTKNKLRGRGHCLSLLFVPECGKDTKLLGWGLDVTVTDVYRR